MLVFFIQVFLMLVMIPEEVPGIEPFEFNTCSPRAEAGSLGLYLYNNISRGDWGGLTDDCYPECRDFQTYADLLVQFSTDGQCLLEMRAYTNYNFNLYGYSYCSYDIVAAKCPHVDQLPFAVNGNWSDWGAWIECSADCSIRVRSCTNPSPQNSGDACSGSTYDITDGCSQSNVSQLYQDCTQRNSGGTKLTLTCSTVILLLIITELYELIQVLPWS